MALQIKVFTTLHQQTMIYLRLTFHNAPAKYETSSSFPPLHNSLVVSTQLKNIRQIGSFPQVGVKIPKIFDNHHPKNSLYISGQISIIPKPELRGFWGEFPY